MLLFEELIKFPIIPKNKTRAKDIVLKFTSANGSGLLLGQLYVMPFHNKRMQDITPIVAKDSVSQQNLCFMYRNLKNCNDYVIQLMFYYAPRGVWLPYSYIVMKEGSETDTLPSRC
jgi:hypothetical protein